MIASTHPYMRPIPSPILEHDIVLNGIRNKNEPRGQENKETHSVE
jgi:hypothetical protein